MNGFAHTVLVVPVEINNYFIYAAKCIESVSHPLSMKVEQTLGNKSCSLRAIKIQHPRVGINALACNFPGNFSCATWKFFTKLHSLKAPLKVWRFLHTTQVAAIFFSITSGLKAPLSLSDFRHTIIETLFKKLLGWCIV